MFTVAVRPVQLLALLMREYGRDVSLVVRCSKGLKVLEYIGAFSPTTRGMPHISSMDSDKSVCVLLVRTHAALPIERGLHCVLAFTAS